MPDYLGAIVGANIRRERAIRGWTQANLANRLGTHRPIVGRTERGTYAPTIETVLAYADALGCHFTRLTIGVDEAVGIRW